MDEGGATCGEGQYEERKRDNEREANWARINPKYGRKYDREGIKLDEYTEPQVQALDPPMCVNRKEIMRKRKK